jgi:hypothetical protein
MTRCSDPVHIIKWYCIAFVLLASMVSADLHADALQLVPGYQDEPTTTNTQGFTNRFLDMLQKEADGPLRSFWMSEIVLFMAISFLWIRHVIVFIDQVKGERVEGEYRTYYQVLEKSNIRSERDIAHLIKCVTKDRHRTFCLGLIVLQFYYSEYLERRFPMIHTNPFMCSCLGILFDRAFFWTVGNVITKKCDIDIGNTGDSDSDEDLEEPQRQRQENASNEAKTRSVYTNISDENHDLQKASMFFFAQLLLMLYYVYSLNDKESFQREDDVSFVKWFGAMLLTVIAGKYEVGSEYEFGFWKEWEANTPKNKKFLDKLDTFPAPTLFGCVPLSLPIRYEWRLRKFYSLCVNLIFRQVILSTAPVMLSVAEPLDFIRDAFAVLFITNLDDLPDADKTTYEAIAEAIKQDLRAKSQAEATGDQHDTEEGTNCESE